MPRGKRRRRERPTPPLVETPAAPECACRVVGCVLIALERHEGPNGVVWLCGKCGMTARRNLREAKLNEEITDLMAAPFKRLTMLRQEQRERQYAT